MSIYVQEIPLIVTEGKAFSVVKIKKRYNNRKPWLSEGLRNSIKIKNKLYLNYCKVKSVTNEVMYKNYPTR